jgi:fucose permease
MLLQGGMSWKWLYLIAAALCVLLLLGTALAPFPQASGPGRTEGRSGRGAADAGRSHALFFAALLVLYVAAEAAVYVWAPTYLPATKDRWRGSPRSSFRSSSSARGRAVPRRVAAFAL